MAILLQAEAPRSLFSFVPRGAKNPKPQAAQNINFPTWFIIEIAPGGARKGGTPGGGPSKLVFLCAAPASGRKMTGNGHILRVLRQFRPEMHQNGHFARENGQFRPENAAR